MEPTHRMESDEMSLKEMISGLQAWFKYLLSKWRIFLVAGLLGGAFGLAYSLWKRPLYTATTTFVLESNDTKVGLGSIAGMAALAGIDLGGDAGGLFQGDNILELYRSRRMLAQTLLSEIHPDSNKLLIERFIAYNGFKENWDGQPELLALDFRRDPANLIPQALRLRDSVVNLFVDHIREDVLTVEKFDKKLSIIQVDVTSPDEVFSKTFNENLVKQVNEFYVQTKTKKSADNIAILQQKVDSVHNVMTKSIYSAVQASDATPNLNPTRQVQRIAPAQEAQFSAEASKAVLSQMLQNLELTKMNLMQEQPLIQLVDQPVYPLEVDRVGKAKGIVLGGLLFGFFTLIALVIIKFYRATMSVRGTL